VTSTRRRRLSTYCVRTAGEQSADRQRRRRRRRRRGTAGDLTEGALWSGLMNAIRRFYRSTTAHAPRAGPPPPPPPPSSSSRTARGSRESAAAAAQRRIDRARGAPLNSLSRARPPARRAARGAALYYTANHARDSSRYLLGPRRAAPRRARDVARVGRCPLIEANGVRPRRAGCPVAAPATFLYLCTRRSGFLSATRRPRETRLRRLDCVSSRSLTASRSSNLQHPVSARRAALSLFLSLVALFLLIPGKQVRRAPIHL